MQGYFTTEIILVATQGDLFKMKCFFKDHQWAKLYVIKIPFDIGLELWDFIRLLCKCWNKTKMTLGGNKTTTIGFCLKEIQRFNSCANDVAIHPSTSEKQKQNKKQTKNMVGFSSFKAECWLYMSLSNLYRECLSPSIKTRNSLGQVKAYHQIAIQLHLFS